MKQSKVIAPDKYFMNARNIEIHFFFSKYFGTV